MTTNRFYSDPESAARPKTQHQPVDRFGKPRKCDCRDCVYARVAAAQAQPKEER